MNALAQARAESHQRIDAAAEAAKQAVREHAALELDRIKVKVGWMNRSAGQARRYRRQAK